MFTFHTSCATCQLTYFTCPGHFGHIELPSPVFHPLFMANMYNLLRGTCMFCHRFKMSRTVVSVSYLSRTLLDFICSSGNLWPNFVSWRGGFWMQHRELMNSSYGLGGEATRLRRRKRRLQQEVWKMGQIARNRKTKFHSWSQRYQTNLPMIL